MASRDQMSVIDVIKKGTLPETVLILEIIISEERIA